MLGGLAWAQPLPRTGDAFQTVHFDLDQDGRKETLTLAAYNVISESDSYFGRLKVADASGRFLWTAPRVQSAAENFAFGSWPFGWSNIEWLGDIDHDKKFELLSPEPVSDLRPITYRRYRWQNNAFVPLPPKMLLEIPLGSGHFRWSSVVEWDGVTPIAWVAKLSESPSVVAEVVSVRSGDKILGGRAKMKMGRDGLHVASWLAPLALPSQP